MPPEGNGSAAAASPTDLHAQDLRRALSRLGRFRKATQQRALSRPGAGGTDRAALGYLALAEAAGHSSETCLAHGEARLAGEILAGARALLHEVDACRPDPQSPAAAFARGAIAGLTGLELVVERNRRMYATGKLVGATLGLGADGVALAAAITGELAGGAAAVAGGPLLVVPAAEAAALAAGVASAATAAAAQHWERLQQSKQAYYDAIRVPAQQGKWTGARGESGWASSRPEVTRVTGGEPVPFRNGFPQFRRWVRERVTLDGLTRRKHDFARADRWLAEKLGLGGRRGARTYRRSEGLSWHHHEDGRTLELVPRDLHANVPHQGGVSVSGRGAP